MSIRAKARGSGGSDKERTLAQVAYRDLKQDILAGRRPAGSIFQGADVAAELRMSRTPVHEALKALARDGLVRPIPRVGYLVSPITANDVHEIFQLRLVLETTAVELAASRVTSDLLERLNAALEVPKGLTQAQAHREFHMVIASIAGSRRLAEIIGQLLDESQRLIPFDPSSNEDRAVTSHQAHVEIVRAIESHDRATASGAMVRHVTATQSRILSVLLPQQASLRDLHQRIASVRSAPEN